MTGARDDDHPDPTVAADNVLPFTREMHRGQLRIAERFAGAYAHRYLYVHGIGWHYWCDTHWREDRNGHVRRAAVDLYKQLRHEAADMDNADRRKELFQDVQKCESAAGITGVLDIARHMHPMTISAEDINPQAHLFNATNGTLNLDTGELQPHEPRDLITKVAGTHIDPNASSELFDEFLATVLPDEHIRNYLARVFGLALLGKVLEHTLPILTGTGGNGKGVFTEVMLAALGDYGITVDPKLIMQTKHEQHGTFKADLHGARLVVTSETNEGEVLAASTVKRLTGGDPIRANRMRENPFEFAPSHSLVYMTNHKPKVSADDKAMWRRLSVIPFDITVEDPDVKLPEKIKADLPGVLAWAYRGWLDYQQNGLNPPETILARTESYRSENDPIGQFLEEVTVTGPYAYVQATKLYHEWQSWILRQGMQLTMTQNEFGRRLRERGYEKGTGRKSRCYVELGIASEEDPSLI